MHLSFNLEKQKLFTLNLPVKSTISFRQTVPGPQLFSVDYTDGDLVLVFFIYLFICTHQSTQG